MLVVLGSKPLVMSLNILPLHSPPARVYGSAGPPSGYSSRNFMEPSSHSFSQSVEAPIDGLALYAIYDVISTRDWDSHARTNR